MAKLLSWVALNGASVLGIVQAIIKCAKELITAILNLFAVVVPNDKFKQIVLTVRDWVNKVDAFVEQYKGLLIK